jgi:hypothetical protein
MRNRLRTKAARFYPAPFLEIDRAIVHEARTCDAKDMLVKIARERVEYCRRGLRDANGARRLQAQLRLDAAGRTRLIAFRAGGGASLAWSDRSVRLRKRERLGATARRRSDRVTSVEGSQRLTARVDE